MIYINSVFNLNNLIQLSFSNTYVYPSIKTMCVIRQQVQWETFAFK